MVLELLRRTSREYDRYIFRQHLRHSAPLETRSPNEEASPSGSVDSTTKTNAMISTTTANNRGTVGGGFRPSLLQQGVRALLHMLQFAVAYFIMLLAMYYNGYIIICIFIGAYIGFFVFGWQTVGLG